MIRKPDRKLKLSRETLRHLTPSELSVAVGGVFSVDSCPPPPPPPPVFSVDYCPPPPPPPWTGHYRLQ